MLVSAFAEFTLAYRTPAEINGIRSLIDRVATKTAELLVTGYRTHETESQAYLSVPNRIGDKSFWLQLLNDSTSSWLQGGLGDTPTKQGGFRSYLPRGVVVSGQYISGHGAICLTYHFNSTSEQIELSGSTGGN